MNNEKQKKELADGLTRRGFLTLGGVAALGAGAALAGCSPQASSASSAGDAATAASAADAAEGLAPSPWGDYYPWPANPPEITDDMVEEELDCDVAVVGLGVSGRMIADALAFLGADISYYSRSHKPDAEAAGMKYKPLDALLRESEVVFTCLNKNVLLLGEPEFEALGEGKVLFNTSIGPGFDSAALEKWLDKPGTHFFCDTYAAAGPVSEGFFRRPNVHSPGVSAGRTRQAFVLLSQKVLANIETALGE